MSSPSHEMSWGSLKAGRQQLLLREEGNIEPWTSSLAGTSTCVVFMLDFTANVERPGMERVDNCTIAVCCLHYSYD